MKKTLDQKGYTLVELLIAVAILGSVASSVILARSYMAKQTVKTSDRSYATQKAIQMFEELKSLVSGKETNINILDRYTDGSLYNNVLTTDKNVDTGLSNVDPGNPLSGNRLSNGNWRYLRQIEVNHVADDPNARMVFVNIWKYASDQNPGAPGDLLAQVGGQLRTIVNQQYPSQVMDVYVLAINNTPAWWTQEPALFSTFRGIIDDIQTRDPGLLIRPHYITRSSYGRDQQYIPYLNFYQSTASATMGGILPYIYFYPGTTPMDTADGGGVTQFFSSDVTFGAPADGNFNLDGTVHYTNAIFTGCPNYAVADKDNNSMRYPDELTMYQAVTAAANNLTMPLYSGYPITEISERMLIEGMLSTPASFENALIVNLHGELLPIPPMRNYSDAAKDPANTSGSGEPCYRVVTHPENLYYPFSGATNTTQVHFRVYSYIDGLENMNANLDATYPDGAGALVPVMNVYIPEVIKATNISVNARTGNSSTAYSSQAVALNTPFSFGAPYPATSYYNVVPVPSTGTQIGTEIIFYNTPYRCPMHTTSTTGLASTARLYGAEYIPCPIETGGNPWDDIGGTTGNGPKNTTRWLLMINLPPGVHTLETRFGTSTTSGFPVNNSPNLSRTWVWCGDAYPPPYTERYQFLGDPRHCPYEDVKEGWQGAADATAGAVIGPNGYNWWFKDGAATGTYVGMNHDGYTGFGAAGDFIGWEGAASSGGTPPADSNFIDAPRFYQMIRQGLLNCTAIWTTMNGYSYYYYGFGGEFGADQQPFQGGVTLNQTPYLTTSTTNLTGAAEIIPYNDPVSYMRVISNTNDTWYEKSWLGELYPDSMYSTWSSTGNLPVAGANISNSTFYRKLYGSVPVVNTAGTTTSCNGFGRNLTSRAWQYGCTSFFDSTFNHQSNADSATLLGLGVTCYSIFAYPLAQSVSCTRSWAINTTQTTTEWSTAPYGTTLRTTLTVPQVGGLSRYFYDDTSSATYNGTGVVQITDKSGNVAYVVESGLAISPDVGTAQLGKTALVFMLRTFLDGGNYTGTAHITQMPLVALYCDSPNEQYSQPSTINLVVDGAVTTTTPKIVSGVTIINGPTDNIWYRYPGNTGNNANFYTEEYPGYPNLNNSTYVEKDSNGNPLTLDINLLYSNDSEMDWYFVQDNSSAVMGVLDTSPNHLIQTNTFPYSYAWAVPSSGFPQGDYTVMVEAFRHSYPLNYSYHKLDLSISR